MAEDNVHPGASRQLLYGQDPSPGIVAVEQAGDSSVVLYRREVDGTVRREEDRFHPWLIAERPGPWTSLRGVTEIQRLRGDHPLCYLVDFASWQEYSDAARAARESSEPFFRFRSPTEQYLVRSGKTLFKSMVFDELLRLQLDIETLGLDPDDPESSIITIAMRLSTGQERFFANEAGEADLIQAATAWLIDQNPDVIEGHNVFNFDLPFLHTRAKRLGLDVRWGRDGSPLWVGDREQRFKAGPLTLPYRPGAISGRHIIDTYQQIQRYDVAGRLSSYALKNVMAVLFPDHARPVIAGSAIRETWQHGNLQDLEAYNLADVHDVDQLSRLTLPTEFYQAQLLPRSLQSTATGGPGEKINDLMVRSYIYQRHGLPRAQPPRPYPGGHAELLAVGSFSPVVKCDVESLYPSIMLRERIAAASDSLGASLPMLADLTRRRLEAKQWARESNASDREVWEGLQGSFKVLINSFYGYLGYSRGLFNDFDAAEQVTLAGQQLIRSVVDELGRRQAHPIEVDTDGVYFVPPAGVASEEEEICFVDGVGSILPDGIRLAHDGRYKGMLSLKLKNYALLAEDGSVIMKGSSLRSRRIEPCFRDFLRAAAVSFIHGEDAKVREDYFALAVRIRERDLSVSEFSQWTLLNPETAKSQPRLRRLLDRLGDTVQQGERVEIYERDDGELGLVNEYADDENIAFLLRRLHETAERFAPLFPQRADFLAFFPPITVRTDLNAALAAKATEQLTLFG
ncbi:MAG TPA: 3'-5' exonuclease [Thermomicrobiales bacterium]|nr:3'-5' exonuclease [Thermomicrobiales bacterium]